MEQVGKLGGVTDVSGAQNSLEINNLARFAVDDHNKKQNALVEFVKVLGAKQQVVSGTLYYITFEGKDGGKTNVYEAKVWDKPWLNFKEVQEFNLVGKMEQVIGGITDVPGAQNSLEIYNLARFAVDDHNKKQNAFPVEFVKVLGAKQQIVEGILYYITLEGKDRGKTNEYEAKVGVKEWLNFKEVLEFKLVGDAPSVSST